MGEVNIPPPPAMGARQTPSPRNRVKGYCDNVIVNIKPIYLNKHVFLCVFFSIVTKKKYYLSSLGARDGFIQPIFTKNRTYQNFRDKRLVRPESKCQN